MNDSDDELQRQYNSIKRCLHEIEESVNAISMNNSQNSRIENEFKEYKEQSLITLRELMKFLGRLYTHSVNGDFVSSELIKNQISTLHDNLSRSGISLLYQTPKTLFVNDDDIIDDYIDTDIPDRDNIIQEITRFGLRFNDDEGALVDQILTRYRYVKKNVKETSYKLDSTELPIDCPQTEAVNLTNEESLKKSEKQCFDTISFIMSPELSIHYRDNDELADPNSLILDEYAILELKGYSKDVGILDFKITKDLDGLCVDFNETDESESVIISFSKDGTQIGVPFNLWNKDRPVNWKNYILFPPRGFDSCNGIWQFIKKAKNMSYSYEDERFDSIPDDKLIQEDGKLFWVTYKKDSLDKIDDTCNDFLIPLEKKTTPFESFIESYVTRYGDNGFSPYGIHTYFRDYRNNNITIAQIEEYIDNYLETKKNLTITTTGLRKKYTVTKNDNQD